jgi:transposase
MNIPPRREMRIMMRLYHDLGKDAQLAHHELTTAYPSAVSQTTVYRWYKRFQSGVRDTADKKRSGRPKKIDVTRLLDLLRQNPPWNARHFCRRLGVHPTTVARHLRREGYRYLKAARVPYKFRPSEKKNRCRLPVLSVRPASCPHQYIFKLTRFVLRSSGYAPLAGSPRCLGHAQSLPLDESLKTGYGFW